MSATDFSICCRLVGALRQPPERGGHATFFLGFDAQGLPFYKSGSFSAGPLFFCPFCGRRVREGAAEAAADARRAPVKVGEDEEELTRLAAGAADEAETVIAPRRTHESGARGGAWRITGGAPAPHFMDLTSAGLAKRDSGTGRLNSTFS